MENRERQKKAYIHSSRLLRSVMIFLVCLLVIVVVFRGVFALYYHEFYSASRQEFQIPGLSEYFVPQGMTSCGDGNFLLSGYMSNTGFARIYYVNAVGRSRAMERKEALVEKYGINDVCPVWRENTNWAGLLIAIGNEYARGNHQPARLKQKAVRELCRRPEMAGAIRAVTPVGLSPNKQMVARLVKGRHFFLLTQLYRLKNRI